VYLPRIVLAKLHAVASAFDAASGAPADVRACAAVLVADTSVIDDGAILGKPGSLEEAESMIARLAGRTHEVWTRFGVGTPSASPKVLHEETVITAVTFRPLTAAHVRGYAASGEGTDKAGGYAVQGLGAGLVSRIAGSYSNVVGLPACEVLVALEGLGLAP
jgi:septum formation protein